MDFLLAKQVILIRKINVEMRLSTDSNKYIYASYVTQEIGFWENVSSIFEWFSKCIDEDRDYQEYFISKEKLKELLNSIDETLNYSHFEFLLSPTYFDNKIRLEKYLLDLEYTKKVLDNLFLDDNDDSYYLSFR